MLRKKGISKSKLKKHEISVARMEKQLNYRNMFYIPVTDISESGKEKHYLASMDLSKKTLKWKFSKFTKMPLKKNFNAEAFHCEIIGKKIYQIAEPTDQTQKSIFRIYDMKKKKWKTGPKLPGRIKSPLLQRYKGKLYLMLGQKVMPRKGYNVQSMVSAAVYRLDRRKWKRTGSLKYVGKYSSDQGTPEFIKFCAPARNGLVFMDTSVDGCGNVFLYDPVRNKKKPLYYTIGNSNSDPHKADLASCVATRGGIYYTRDNNSEIESGYSLWKLPARSGAYKSIYKKKK